MTFSFRARYKAAAAHRKEPVPHDVDDERFAQAIFYRRLHKILDAVEKYTEGYANTEEQKLAVETLERGCYFMTTAYKYSPETKETVLSSELCEQVHHFCALRNVNMRVEIEGRDITLSDGKKIENALVLAIYLGETYSKSTHKKLFSAASPARVQGKSGPHPH